MTVTIKFIHLLALIVWLGGMAFFSFIVAPSIFSALPTETAGNVVAAIFPKYWLIGYVCSGIILITLIVLGFFEKTFPVIRILIVVLMAVTTLYAGVVVGGKAREIKSHIRVIEDGAEKTLLMAKFRTLHRRSVTLNSIVMILGITFTFITARQLRT
jgi:uncharacterized membrane protein